MVGLVLSVKIPEGRSASGKSTVRFAVKSSGSQPGPVVQMFGSIGSSWAISNYQMRLDQYCLINNNNNVF